MPTKQALLDQIAKLQKQVEAFDRFGTNDDYPVGTVFKLNKKHGVGDCTYTYVILKATPHDWYVTGKVAGLKFEWNYILNNYLARACDQPVIATAWHHP